MSHLRQAIAEYSDAYLLDQYYNCKDEYTPEAIGIMKEELDRRQLSEKDLLKAQAAAEVSREPGDETVVHLDTKDFVELDHTFSHTDILLAQTILRDQQVPFFIDNPSSSDTLPIKSEAEAQFTIHVHKEYTEQAHELINEHFEKNETGVYILKHSDIKDRLRAFNFSDVHLSEIEAKEELEVSFSEEEKRIVAGYASRLISEVDTIEERQNRVLFYFDALEPLIERLEDRNRTVMSRSDLLAIMEILQIYCDEKDFPPSMNGPITTLLGFFLGD